MVFQVKMQRKRVVTEKSVALQYCTEKEKKKGGEV